MYLQTRGLVIREVEYSESDKLLTVLTPEHGALTLKARGVRRSSSPLKAACQLLCYSSFTASSYQNYYSITEAEPVEMFLPLRQDLELLSLGAWLAQAAQIVSEADTPSPELLQLLLSGLNALTKGRDQRLVKAAFELRLMCLAGFQPDLSGCAVCGREDADGFDVTRGLLCCLKCRDAERGLCLPLDASALDAMRYCVQAQPGRLYSFRVPEAALAQLGQVSETYLIAQFQRSFSALDFYKALFSPLTPADGGQ